MKLALCAFTAAGAALARYIAQLPGYSCTLRPRDMPLDEFVTTWMPDCEGLVFVGAAGIAVRAIAPHLRRKDRDPAVLVLDEKGQFVIPILSGHLGGANALATKLARQLGATPVLTTATDLNGVFAVDLWSQKAGCVIGEIDRIRAVSGTLLRGQTVGLYSDFEVRGQLPPGLETGTGAQVGLCISLDGKRQPFTTTLHLYPRIVTVGVGCKKGTDAQALRHRGGHAATDGRRFAAGGAGAGLYRPQAGGAGHLCAGAKVQPAFLDLFGRAVTGGAGAVCRIGFRAAHHRDGQRVRAQRSGCRRRADLIETGVRRHDAGAGGGRLEL